MGLTVQFHNPTHATVFEFELEGNRRASVRFHSADGEEMPIYTTPAAAHAIADAFNAAILAKLEVVA